MLADRGGEEATKQLKRACAELERRLRAGEDCRAETFFASFPALAAQADTAVELIYTEYVTREQLGQPPPREELYARFPQWRGALQRQLDIHDLIPREDGDDARVLGRYRLLQEIGRGGLAVVYKALDLNANRTVAVKKVREDVDPEAEARFRDEAENMSLLKHPHIVQVYEVGEHEGRPFFAMEFLEGGDLKARIAGEPQPAKGTAELVKTLAQAMDYAHQKSIIHRDLKPANVVLTADGKPKITDFGLAKQLDGGLGRTLSGAVLGTPPYMAPEQARGNTKAIDRRTDVYALGAILYEMLTGRPPFQGVTAEETIQQVLTRHPRRPRKFHRGVDRRLESICLKCLEKKPRRRYDSAKELEEDLARWQRDERPRAHRWYERAPRAVRRHAVASLAAVLLGLAALVGAAVIHFSDPDRPLRAVEQKLAAGQEVTLIGETGEPRWRDWGTRDAQTTVYQAPDGTFSVQASGLGLLKLVRDPRHESYRFGVEVRHETSQLNGVVGIYWAHSQHVTAQGKIEHYFCTLSFNDVDDRKKLFPNLKAAANRVRFSLRRYVEGGLPEDGLDFYEGEGLPFEPTRVLPGSRPWHVLTVEVRPQQVCTYWRTPAGEDKLVSAPTRSRLLQKAEDLPLDPAAAAPELAPRGALGLYVYKGSASFRRVTVKPLVEGN